jgi:hypothetical protein
LKKWVSMKTYTLALLFISFSLAAYAQNDLLAELEAELPVEKNYTEAAFKGLKIINIESTKMAEQGALYFIVAHRFGSIKNGLTDFFGLDMAITKLQLIYGITNSLNVGLARSSLQKTYGIHTKFRLLRQQQEVMPFTVGLYALTTVNTALDKAFLPDLEFNNRLTHTAQLLISRKWNEKLSLQLSPTYLHENLTTINSQDNGQFILAMGGRYKLNKRVSLNMDYGFHTNRSEDAPYRNPFSVGLDIETGGHVFQLHFTNAQSMFENGFFGQATGDWSEGDVYFGFNISRVFDW